MAKKKKARRKRPSVSVKAAKRKAKIAARERLNQQKTSLIVYAAPKEMTSRYDINTYGGGADHIRHVGLIKKRRG